MKYKIKYGIEMKSHIKNPPLNIIDNFAVKRAGNAEYGPLDLFQIVKKNKKYKIKYDYENETIKMNSTNTPIKRKKTKDNLTDKECHILKIKNYKWYSAKDLTKKMRKKYLDDTHGVNVFGEVGILKINKKHSLNIPLVNAIDCQKMLKNKFGVKLYAPGEVLPSLKVKGKDLYMVSYQINSHFASKYVHKDKGPGIFLEHHNFPHYVTPISKDARGPIVVGKITKNVLSLVGVTIPIGHTLYLPEYTVHNDWYFIGKMATTVAVDESDTVFIRGQGAKRIAMDFLQKPHVI